MFHLLNASDNHVSCTVASGNLSAGWLIHQRRCCLCCWGVYWCSLQLLLLLLLAGVLFTQLPLESLWSP